jgi:probable F420-dependent oxidoreductase
MVKLGTNLPEHLIATDHGALTEFLVALEEMGYHYVTVGDHVVGADLSVRPDWRPYFGKRPLYDHHMLWHEPMVLFGFLTAITHTIEFSTGILISPQRQTALLAKQAAEVAVLSGGRIRLVLGTGWNDVEYQTMGVDFHHRGALMEEQVEVLRRLWTEEVVTYSGRFHTVSAAGINPLPSAPIPLWFGGQSEVVLRRTGRIADGWFPYYPYFSEDTIRTDLAVIHDSARQAGRDPGDVGLEGAIYMNSQRFDMPAGSRLPPVALEDCVEYAHTWKTLGADRYWVTAPWANLGPEETGIREPGKAWSGIGPRLKALQEFKEAVGPDF